MIKYIPLIHKEDLKQKIYEQPCAIEEIAKRHFESTGEQILAINYCCTCPKCSPRC
jgi:hypothetical protein